ncbi:YdiK family protein [Bacillus multifaciens]|uniref:YdiK family protein n=1 Tax=Bacillus multifaciens TaxID=3068506 RepID=UPI0027417E5F|nr:YdiK family protein [Bacillus sp. WLY-B-L8]MDP7981327.1 YdiK family protein [Bacillus sp. WLY-B-L8]HDX9591152.1 YdiK family protein [Bacillus pseudomycoides]
MRNSPFVMATLYFLLGCIFTYLAITSVKDTIWNFYTLLLSVMATVDFNLAIRLLFSKQKKDSKKK